MSAGLSPALPIAARPAWTAPVTRPKSLSPAIGWPGWPWPQPQMCTGGRGPSAAACAEVTITAIAPLETSEQSSRCSGSATQRERLVVGQRDRFPVLGGGIAGRPLPLRDRDGAELLARRAEPLHVPPGSERVVDGHAAESVAGREPGEPVPLGRSAGAGLGAPAERAAGRHVPRAAGCRRTRRPRRGPRRWSRPARRSARPSPPTRRSCSRRRAAPGRASRAGRPARRRGRR